MPVKLRAAAPVWTEEDWKRSVSFQLPKDSVGIVPIRHPANDNTWSVGIYIPAPAVHGHKLHAYATRCKTYEDALKAASFIQYDHARNHLGFNIPEGGQEFWESVRATY
jgi:hypothetical protein